VKAFFLLVLITNERGMTLNKRYVPKEGLRRQALAASGNLWYLPERPVVRDQKETLLNRTPRLTVKGTKNGIWGVPAVRHNPIVWTPTLLLGLVWAWRWHSAGTI